MGRSRRIKPVHLAEKLKRIRLGLGLSQTQIVKKLNYTKGSLVAPEISDFENDKREPALPLLLRYSKISGVSLEEIVDDDLDLPEGF